MTDKKTKVESALDDLSGLAGRYKRSYTFLRAAAYAKAILTLLFGGSLFASNLWPKYELGDSDELYFLEHVPHWPQSAGLLFMMLGLASLLGMYEWPKSMVLVWTFRVMSACWAFYGAAYIVGTLAYGGLVGPQFMYLGLAVTSGIVAVYLQEEHDEY